MAVRSHRSIGREESHLRTGAVRNRWADLPTNDNLRLHVDHVYDKEPQYSRRSLNA